MNVMRTLVLFGLFGLLALFVSAGAQQPAPTRTQPPTAGTAPAGGQLPDLGRPTTAADKMPLFDFDAYFLGKWAFEWDVPEGPLGPEGTVKGTVTYRRVDDRFYEADTEATGAWGSFKVKELIAYHKDYKTAARHVTDTRGFSYMQLAPVGGDLGGYYSFYYEGSPFTYKGQTLRINNSMRLFSPTQYQNQTRVSVGGRPFMTYGNPWFKREGPAATSR